MVTMDIDFSLQGDAKPVETLQIIHLKHISRDADEELFEESRDNDLTLQLALSQLELQ